MKIPKIKSIVDAETYNQDKKEPVFSLPLSDKPEVYKTNPMESEQKSIADFNKLGRKQRKPRVVMNPWELYQVKIKKLESVYHAKRAKLGKKLMKDLGIEIPK